MSFTADEKEALQYLTQSKTFEERKAIAADDELANSEITEWLKTSTIAAALEDAQCRTNLANALNAVYNAEQAIERLEASKALVVRLKLTRNGTTA